MRGPRIYLDTKMMTGYLDVKTFIRCTDSVDAVDRILEQWRAQRPDLDVRAMGPIGRLTRVARRFSGGMEQTFARYGLNAAGFDVLATLRRAGPPYSLSAGELMASMMITSGTTTNRIDQLCKVGLVCRTSDPRDARRALVTLTPEGYELIEKAIAEHVATQAALLADLSDADIRQLDRLLAKLMPRSSMDTPGSDSRHLYAGHRPPGKQGV